MSFQFNNIRDFKVMYLASLMGEVIQEELNGFEFIEEYYVEKSNTKLTFINHYIYNLLVSKFGGISNFLAPNIFRNNSILYNVLNEIIYDNLKNEKKIEIEINQIMKELEKRLDIVNKKKNINDKRDMDYFTINSAKFLTGNGDKNQYYSLIFIGIPFALKIKDKKELINSLKNFVSKYTSDINQILSTITAALFVHYALNDVGINIWINKLNDDLKIGEKKDYEKYIDYLNNYYENNFRNEEFKLKAIDEIINERNKNFINNYCSHNNLLLSEKPEHQILLIYDTLLRSKDNWEKTVLFGFCNWNDNTIISLVLGILYEILYKNNKINKNLLKRFSFNL
jgi:hypothetical protein